MLIVLINYVSNREVVVIFICRNSCTYKLLEECLGRGEIGILFRLFFGGSRDMDRKREFIGKFGIVVG